MEKNNSVNIVKMIFGIVLGIIIILLALLGNGFYVSLLSTKAIISNIFSSLLIVLGIWLIVETLRKNK
jgi:apolipoprotein N-acyltransferase